MQKRVLEIFNNNVFSIPNYQRDYAWEARNLDDLWEDLLEAQKATKDEMGHFLGTIVVAKNPNNPQIYDIIDGQQRATTLFMLRYALNQKTKDPNRNLNNFLDDDDNFRLQVIPDNQEFFKKILDQAKQGKLNSSLEQNIKTDGQRRLYEVFKEIWSHIGELETNRAKELLSVLDKMVLMWLEEKDSGRAIRMFQTVNDRGMPLLLLDKLKSLLILYSNKYCDGELDRVINERFGVIFKIITQMRKQEVISSLGDKDFNKELEARIFNYHALSQQDIGNYRYGAGESYKKLKDLLKGKIKDNIEPQMLKEWLDDYSKDLQEFFEAFLAIMKKSMQNKELFKLLFVLKIDPYFYSSLIRLEMGGILDDENIILLAQAQILFYGFGSSNDSRAYQLYQYTTSKDEFRENLKMLSKDCAKGGWKNFNEIFKEIAYGNYEWGKYFHYLFFTYRCDSMDIGSFIGLLGDKKTYSYTIEHIVPQNAVKNGSLGQYGFDSEDEFIGQFRDSFGNLLVLEGSLNSSHSDAGLAKKQENYKQSKIFYNKAFANKENFLSFGKKDITSENEKFTQWAREFFKDFL